MSADHSSTPKLSIETVRAVVVEQFPQLCADPVEEFGSGWDHQLFLIGHEWVVRFPRRAERIPWLEREIQIMDLVSPALGPEAPRFELIGEPSNHFPYRFVAYRPIPGVAADSPVRARPFVPTTDLAADVARILSKLHRLDASGIPPTPAAWEPQPWTERAADLVREANASRSALPPELRAAAEPYLTGAQRPPGQDRPSTFIHNDICPDHLIVDPRTGRLNGLIDFTDAMLGEPVLDFVGLIGLGGYPFIAQVAKRYELPLGEAFTAKLTWLARTLTLTWLAEAAEHDPAQIPKHLTWVRYALDEPTP